REGFTIDNGRLAPPQFAAVLRELVDTGEITVRDGERLWLVTGGVGEGTAPPAAILARQVGIDVVCRDGSVFSATAPDRPDHERLVGPVDVGAAGQVGMAAGEVDDGGQQPGHDARARPDAGDSPAPRGPSGARAQATAS